MSNQIRVICQNKFNSLVQTDLFPLLFLNVCRIIAYIEYKKDLNRAKCDFYYMYMKKI